MACDRACAYVCVLLVVALLTSQFSSSSSAVPHRRRNSLRLRLHYNITLYASIIEYMSARAPVCVFAGTARTGSSVDATAVHCLFRSCTQYAHTRALIFTKRPVEYSSTPTTSYDDDSNNNNN